MARDGERVSTLTVGYEPQAVSFHPTQPEVAIGGKVHSNSDVQLHIIHLYTYIIFHKSVKMLATQNFLWFWFFNGFAIVCCMFKYTDVNMAHFLCLQVSKNLQNKWKIIFCENCYFSWKGMAAKMSLVHSHPCPQAENV